MRVRLYATHRLLHFPDPIPGILPGRILERGCHSFSMHVCAKLLSVIIQLCLTSCGSSLLAPPSVGSPGKSTSNIRLQGM